MGITLISSINFTFLLLFFLTSCVSKKDKSKIDDEIVLKIGSFEITRYEYEKNKKREADLNRYGNPEYWLNKYISNSYFLADAYDQKYDTISSINKKVDYASITMLGQFKGYLWNKVEEPKLIFTKKEIKQIYKKQNKLFDLEYFLFADEILFNSILNNDTAIRTEANFKNLINKCQTNLVKYINLKLLYPFFELEPAKERIYTLKQGDIVTIHFKNGKILIAHLKGIKEIKQQEFETERDNIYSNLKLIKEKQIVEDKRNSIFKEAKIVINEEVEEKILRDLKSSKPLRFLETFIADTVLKYQINKESKSILAADFFDYYINNPFMYIINDKESLSDLLKGIVEEKYLYAESLKRGIINEKKFILDKRDFMNRLILSNYYMNNFSDTSVSNRDMHDFYNTHLQSFSQCKSCYVTVFTFKNKNSAYLNLNLINKIASQNGIIKSSDTSMVGKLSYHENDIIELKNDKYPSTIIQKIFNSKMNTPIGPLEFNNHIYLFIKRKELGQKIQPFELVKENIKEQLITKKRNIWNDNKLKELKGKYPVIINKILK